MEDHLQDLLLSRYANPHEHEVCICGGGKRLVQCRDCFQYQTSCAQCFITSHRNLPLHWAFVWDLTRKHFMKRDYTSLTDDCTIQLGHEDSTKPAFCDGSITSHQFTIVHSNGVHTTRIRFCGCAAAGDKVTQLMQSHLFPATPLDPRTAFTFSVLKDFHMHNLQSKCGAFDFMLSLRRLTNNVFTDQVPVSVIHYTLTNFVHLRVGSIQGFPSSNT